MTEIRDEESAIYNEISRLGASLWDASLKVVGLNTDPKMFSVMLYKRLWSNHRGYTLLHNNGLSLEADIVLRSGLEAAICIAANYRLREEFVLLMKQDTASTLQGQIKIHRDDGSNDLVKDAEANLRQLQAQMPKGTKPARLDWKMLAEKGQVPQLYGFHRMLSGVSSHVTGISMLKGVVGVAGDGANLQNDLRKISRKFHLMMMAGATLHGSLVHAGMIDDEEHARTANELVNRLNDISSVWGSNPDH